MPTVAARAAGVVCRGGAMAARAAIAPSTISPPTVAPKAASKRGRIRTPPEGVTSAAGRRFRGPLPDAERGGADGRRDRGPKPCRPATGGRGCPYSARWRWAVGLALGLALPGCGGPAGRATSRGGPARIRFGGPRRRRVSRCGWRHARLPRRCRTPPHAEQRRRGGGKPRPVVIRPRMPEARYTQRRTHRHRPVRVPHAPTEPQRSPSLVPRWPTTGSTGLHVRPPRSSQPRRPWAPLRRQPVRTSSAEDSSPWQRHAPGRRGCGDPHRCAVAGE